MKTPDWSGASGDIWARRWRDTDRALAGVAAALDQAILEAAPEGAFKALDVGCGPGTTSLSLAARRPDASILGCDLSEALVAIAAERATGLPNARFVAEDAEQAARAHGPFELIVSRHGVMFFGDPHDAFRTLREATAAGGRLVFSCFRSWEENPWAAELASAAAGTILPPPGREPSGFAFADPDYVRDILTSAGWADAQPEPLDFSYAAGEGPQAIEQALDFLTELGPASRVLENLDGGARDAAIARVREAIAGHQRDGRVTFFLSRLDLAGRGVVSTAERNRVRLIGLPTDSHSSFLRGAASAPTAIRAALASEHSNRATEFGDEFGLDIPVEDSGDLPLLENGDDPAKISDSVEATARDGAVPICLGGDHMVTFPIMAGLAQVHGPVNILHFDAHPDLYDDFEGDPLSHASPFARIMEKGLAKRLVQVGIRTMNRHCREQAERFGVEVIEMRDFAPDRVPIPGAPLYVSIDLDGLDPAFAPGVSHHEPGGLSTRDILSILHRINGPIVGADVVELNPSRDINQMTATVAAKLVKELAGLARRGE